MLEVRCIFSETLTVIAAVGPEAKNFKTFRIAKLFTEIYIMAGDTFLLIILVLSGRHLQARK